MAISLNDRGRHSEPLAVMSLPMKSVKLRLKSGHNPGHSVLIYVYYLGQV